MGNNCRYRLADLEILSQFGRVLYARRICSATANSGVGGFDARTHVTGDICSVLFDRPLRTLSLNQRPLDSVVLYRAQNDTRPAKCYCTCQPSPKAFDKSFPIYHVSHNIIYVDNIKLITIIIILMWTTSIM